MEWHQEVWAEALWVEQHKGEHGSGFIAERIASLARDGDHGGVSRWERIGAAYDALQSGKAR